MITPGKGKLCFKVIKNLVVIVTNTNKNQKGYQVTKDTNWVVDLQSDTTGGIERTFRGNAVNQDYVAKAQQGNGANGGAKSPNAEGGANYVGGEDGTGGPNGGDRDHPKGASGCCRVTSLLEMALFVVTAGSMAVKALALRCY